MNNVASNTFLKNKQATPYTLKVYLEDTDASGFVYHANYIKYFERARTETLYHKGICHAQLLAQQKTMFVVYSIEVNFIRPAVLADILEIYTEITEIRGARVILKQSIVKQGQLLVQASIALAYIHLDTAQKKPLRIPDFITSALLLKIKN